MLVANIKKKKKATDTSEKTRITVRSKSEVMKWKWNAD